MVARVSHSCCTCVAQSLVSHSCLILVLSNRLDRKIYNKCFSCLEQSASFYLRYQNSKKTRFLKTLYNTLLVIKNFIPRLFIVFDLENKVSIKRKINEREKILF